MPSLFPWRVDLSTSRARYSGTSCPSSSQVPLEILSQKILHESHIRQVGSPGSELSTTPVACHRKDIPWTHVQACHPTTSTPHTKAPHGMYCPGPADWDTCKSFVQCPGGCGLFLPTDHDTTLSLSYAACTTSGATVHRLMAQWHFVARFEALLWREGSRLVLGTLVSMLHDHRILWCACILMAARDRYLASGFGHAMGFDSPAGLPAFEPSGPLSNPRSYLCSPRLL